MNQSTQNLDLSTAKVTDLIRKFALPAILSSLVGSIYNLADQIFIGQKLGTAGNAATNVAFPLVLLMVTFSMVIGSGGASRFSLHQGAGEMREAGETVGNSLVALVCSGLALMSISLIFLRPLMALFGAKGQTLDLAFSYTQITVIGMPFYILGTGWSMFIRADGSPKYAMVSTIAGTIINIILDPILIFVFNMGIRGAGIATVAGQIISAVIAVSYLPHFKGVSLKKQYFSPNFKVIKNILLLGAPIGLMQIAVMMVQIVMNNVLGYYGELSNYGRDIPLAVAGIVSKVSTVFNSITMGICQSCQPIFGYNHGAGNHSRVKETYRQTAVIVTTVSTVAFLLFQCFPIPILEIFQHGNPQFLSFGSAYLRVFMFATFLNGIQILTANFFPAIGNPKKGTLASLSRQVLFQLPLILILPRFMGINGVLFAGPIADTSACVLSLFLLKTEFKEN